MSENLLIERREIGDYRISIYYDQDNECPCTNWDMGAVYLFEFMNRYHHQLSTACNWRQLFSDNNHSLEDALGQMVVNLVPFKDIVAYIKNGKLEDWRLVYNRSTRLWELQSYNSRFRDEPYWDTEKEFEPYELNKGDYTWDLVDVFQEDELVSILQNCAKNLVFKQWSSHGYSQGDYMEGVAYMTKERFDKMCGFSGHYKTWQEQAEAVIDAEVKAIEMWAWGDVIGFVLEKKVRYTKVYDDTDRADEDEFDWEEIDSCWGCYMEPEELVKEVMAEHDIKEVA